MRKIELTNSQKNYLEGRLHMIATKGLWEGFLHDYWKAMDWYTHTITAVKEEQTKTVHGENEPSGAKKMAGILENTRYLNSYSMFSGWSGMSRLQAYQQLEQKVIEVTSAVNEGRL